MNEDNIKAMIVDGHKRGVCDTDGVSAKVTNTAGKRVFIAKPRIFSSAAKTYVYRNGEMVLKG